MGDQEKKIEKPLFLLIEANEMISEDLSFFLTSKFSVRVQCLTNIRDTIEFIKNCNEKIYLIIVQESIEIPSLIKYFNKNRIPIPCILIAENESTDVEQLFSNNFRHSVFRSNLTQELDSIIPSILSQTDFQISDDFCSIPTHLLERVSPIQGDVYIRLSQNKYIRLFAENDTCTASDIEKYAIRKGVKYLYLRKHDINKFMAAINHHLQQVIDFMNSQKNSPREQQEQYEQLAAEAIDSIQSYVLRFGFTEEALSVAEKAIKIAENTVSENPKLSDIFRKFMFHNNRYMPTHSLIIAHVASAIIAELKWNTTGTLYKIIMAAIFHDITLTNDVLAAVTNLEELEKRKSEFSDTEYTEYKNHPFTCAQMIEKFKQIPSDVATIILQHHELPTGKGFPKNLNADHISPLSAVFIVSHELVRKLLLRKSTFSMEEEFLNLVKNYDHSQTFHNILHILDPYNQKQKIKLYG